METITHWFKKQLSNPQVVFLAMVLLAALLVIVYTGNMLAPVISGVVIAYLLEGIVKKLILIKIPRLVAISLVLLVFILCLLGFIFGLLPILYNQLTDVAQQIPSMFSKGQAVVVELPQRYPELFSLEQVDEILNAVRTQMTDVGQRILSSSLSGAASLITILIYLVLLPILIFFFLKDKKMIINWLKAFFPNHNELAIQVWGDVDLQIANYIRGKFWEILIVWLCTFVAFSFLGLQYSMLLSVLVGLSVLIPYVGAAIVTIPVLLIAWFQWGWSGDFITLSVTYLIIQALDGNLLVPLLFSEVVNIHPVAIIVAVLFFGGLWGIWGVFFAIPLATLVQAVIVAWPAANSHMED